MDEQLVCETPTHIHTWTSLIKQKQVVEHNNNQAEWREREEAEFLENQTKEKKNCASSSSPLRLVVWIYFEIGMSLSGPWGVRACRLPFLPHSSTTVGWNVVTNTHTLPQLLLLLLPFSHCYNKKNIFEWKKIYISATVAFVVVVVRFSIEKKEEEED